MILKAELNVLIDVCPLEIIENAVNLIIYGV